MDRVEHLAFPFIREKIKNLSDTPGCYLWKNEAGEIIYVGKALKLSDRVRSYLNPNITDTKTLSLQSEIFDFDWIATHNEEEALILEATLIKKYSPRYNVRLKDDKRYPYICISIDEMYPMVYLTRNVKNDNRRYFGPYTDTRATRDILNLIHKVFPVRKVVQKLPLSKPRRPCLNFHIKRCLGPCQGNVPKEDYDLMIKQVIQFLEGKKETIEKDLKEKMLQYSEDMEYEKAAEIRDRLISIERIRSRQTIVNHSSEDEDIISYAKREDEGQVVILEVRCGRLESKKTFALHGMKDSSEKEIILSFLEQYYLNAQLIPAYIILPASIKEEGKPILAYIQKLTGRTVKLKFPISGPKRALLKLAEKNAEMNLTERILATKLRDQTTALKELQENLKLSSLPEIIECYDISHFQGTEAVASGVMFVDGKPYKQGYRHYKIKGYTGINDPGMIHEVISRRLQRLLNEEEPLPDLIVIDGGPTQLNRACEAALALDLGSLAIISLAKKHEEVYFPGESTPYSFDSNSPSMRLLRHLRDEAHRFGITYHRERRNKSTLKTILDEIPDIGKERRKAILKAFADKSLSEATIEEFMQVEGIGEVLAKKIYEHIHR